LLKGAGMALGLGGKGAGMAGKAGEAVAGGAKEAGLLGKAGGLFKEGGLLSKAGKFLKRIPLLGALLTGGAAAMDIYDSENDDNLTRRDKDERAGKAVGGAVGGLGGMAAGAKLGAMVGALGGPIGIAIGSVVGGAAGMFFGDQAGQILGDTVGGWVNDLRAYDIPGKITAAWDEIKVVALGTWDWMKSGWGTVAESVQKGWDSVVSGFSVVGEGIGKAWQWYVDSAKSMLDSVTSVFSSAYEGLKKLPVIGPAIEAAEAGARKIAEVATTWKDKTVELTGKAVDTVKSTASDAWEGTKSVAGKTWEGTKDFAASMVPQGLKNSVEARRAMETGAEYRQGNIAGLDEAHTRALVASTASTESAGGKLDEVNSAGYMGRYQAGAGWLADAGLVRGGSAAVQAAMKADGFTSEYKWGQSGGMTKFLKNADNWNGGMSYDKYLANADAQDTAFKTNSDKSYANLVKRGVITPNMSQDEIAGLLKARHISGEGGAVQVAKGGTGPTDANGTTARKYYADLASGNIYTNTFTPNTQTIATPTAPAIPPMAAYAAPATPSVVASSRMPSVPATPRAPSISEAPPMTVPLASNGSDRPIQVSIPSPDVGQDVRDRSIAHIVTGGLAAA
jgi:hypothetical protein